MGGVRFRHKMSCEVLADHGAEFLAAAKDQATPMDLALGMKYKDMIYYLRKHGAKE